MRRLSRIIAWWNAYDVFLSYSHEDGKTYAKALHQALASKGIRTFLDTEVYAPGDELRHESVRRIGTSRTLILIATPGAARSSWVSTELQVALAERLRIVPITFDGCEEETADFIRQISSRVASHQPAILVRTNNDVFRPIEHVGQTVLVLKELQSCLREKPSDALLGGIGKLIGTARVRRRNLCVGTSVALIVLLIIAALSWYGKTSRQREQDEQYRAAITRASRLQHEGKFTEATRELWAAPPGGRHWEWFRLLYISHIDLATPVRHDGFISDLAASPDGRLIAAASSDCTASLFSIADRRLVASLKHGAPIESIAFSPDGVAIVTAGQDGRLLVWSTDTGKLMSTPRATGSALMKVQFSPDGSMLVLLCADHCAEIWDRATWTRVARLAAYRDYVVDAAFAPSGQTVATASWDKCVRIWATKTGEKEREWKLPEAVNTVDYDSGGDLLVTTSDSGIIRIWKVRSGDSIELSSFDDWATLARFTPNGEQVIATARDGTIACWDATTGALLRQWRGHDGRIDGLSFSKAGEVFLTAAADNTARVWNTGTGELVGTLAGSDDNVEHAVFAWHDRIVATGGQDGALRLYRPNTNEAPSITVHPDVAISDLAISPDGVWRATSALDNTAILQNLDTGTMHQLAHTDFVSDLQFSADSTILISGSWDGTARMTTLDDLQCTKHEHGAKVSHVALSETVAYSGDLAGAVHAWDPNTGALRFQCSPDGSRAPDRINDLSLGTKFDLIVAAASKSLWFWRASNGSLLGVCEVDQAPLRWARLAPDESCIVTVHGRGDETLTVWARDGTILGQNGAREVESLSFAPDGSLLAVGTMTDILLLSLPSAKLIRALSGHSRGPAGCTFTADGDRVLSIGGDQTLRVWESKTGRELLSFSLGVNPQPQILLEPVNSSVLLPTLDGQLISLPSVISATKSAAVSEFNVTTFQDWREKQYIDWLSPK